MKLKIDFFYLVTSALCFGLASCASVSPRSSEPPKLEPQTISNVVATSPKLLASTVQPSPKFEDLARHADHSAIYMNQDQAFDYCAAKGSHLPSVREYALWSHEQGAAGIRETSYKDIVYTDPLVKAERELNGKSGYFVVYRQTADGKMVVDFYYNRNGYKRPSGEIGDTWFWTASQFPADSGLAFVYDAPAGVVHYGFYHAKWYPVRCVAGRSS